MPKDGKKSRINLARLAALMDERGLDAVVVRSGQNVTYLSGVVFPGTLGRLLDLTDSDRGVLVFWPRVGDPAIITNSIAAGLAKRDSWIEQIEIYEGYIESPYLKLCELLADRGLEKARVGFEEKYVSALHWQDVQRRLPKLKMIDCTSMMDAVRWIKTRTEVELIKRAADLLDDALLAAFQEIRVGDTERRAHSLVIKQCLDRGADWAHGILNSSTNAIPYAGESDVVFNRGDAMRTDYVAYWHGYPGHQSRSLIFGTPSAEQRVEYKINREIYLAAINRCRPGVRSGDIYDFVVSEFAKAGWEYETLLVGHSVGPWWHQQQPILARDNDLLLEEGMVLALEPHRRHWHLQDLIVVRDGAPELLSDKFKTEEPFIVE